MGVQKITFDGSSVSAKVDADIYHFLLSYEVGILKNFKSGVSFTISNNVITFKDGYVSVYGRLVYVENNTQVSITTDSSKFGYVVLGVNTSNDSATIYIKETTSTYPNLTQTNLLNGDGLYELVLCAYSKTTSSVTLNNNYQRSYITNSRDKVYELRSEMLSRFIPQVFTPNKVSNGVYSLGSLDSQRLERSIINVMIGGSTVLTFPGAQIFFIIGSYALVNYRHYGSDYSLNLSYSNGVLTLTCGSTNHDITKIVITTL